MKLGLMRLGEMPTAEVVCDGFVPTRKMFGSSLKVMEGRQNSKSPRDKLLCQRNENGPSSGLERCFYCRTER